MAAEALEQSMLESKDKEQLVAIAQALGIKTTARAAKATLIDKILETTRPAAAGAEPNGNGSHGHGDADAAPHRRRSPTPSRCRRPTSTPPTRRPDAPCEAAAETPAAPGRAGARPRLAVERADGGPSPSRRRSSVPTASRSPTGRST